VSQQKRKRIEEVFGWLKTIGLMRQTRFRAAARGWMFVSACGLHLVRIRNLAEFRRDAPPLLSGLQQRAAAAKEPASNRPAGVL